MFVRHRSLYSHHCHHEPRTNCLDTQSSRLLYSKFVCHLSDLSMHDNTVCFGVDTQVMEPCKWEYPYAINNKILFSIFL